MTILRKLWLGQYSLPITFWVFYALGFFAALCLFAIILAGSYYFRLGAIGFIIGFVVLNSYWFIAAVGVWRSAAVGMASSNWMVRAWAIAARVVVFLAFARALLWLVDGGAFILMERMTARMDF